MRTPNTLSSVVLAGLALATTANAWADSAIHETLLPIAQPTDLPLDPWECVLANLTQYFDPPKPTGNLLDALLSYGDELLEPCTETGVAAQHNCFPPKSDWCQFPAAVATAVPQPPADVMTQYQAYGSSASEWWAGHSSLALSLADECPNRWYNAMFEIPGGAVWLNETIIFAACYEEGLLGVTTSDITTATETATDTTDTATPPGGVTTTTGPVETQTPDLPSPTQAGLASDCEVFHLVETGDGCQQIVDLYNTFTLADFYSWNPAVGTSCGGLWLDYYVCVGVPGTPSEPIAPSPTQANVSQNCTAWYFVVLGDWCQKIADDALISISDFNAWNPDVGTDCSGLWLDYYVCVEST